MQKWILAACSLLAVSVSMTGCGAPPQVDGFIDKNGTLVLDASRLKPKPLGIGDYSEGLAVVKYKDGFGCLNKTGEIIFKVPFRNLRSFHDGVAAFSVGKSAADERWGYINQKGDTVIKPAYTAAEDFSDEAAAVRLTTAANGGKAGRWAYIDKTGTQIMKETFEEAQPFHEGLAPVKVDGKMGCINRIGRFVVPPNYDAVYAVDHGTIVAAHGTGISGKDPDQSLEYYSQDGSIFSRTNMQAVSLENLHPLMWCKAPPAVGAANDRPLSTFVSPGFAGGKSIQQAGNKFVVPQQFDARAFSGAYDYMFPVSEGFFVAYNDSAGGKMDYRGGKPTDENGIWNNHAFRFWDAAPFSDGLGLVQESKGGMYGYVNASGGYALQPIYKHARPFKDGRALVGDSALTYP
ncbi:MAG: WG repeat-containing protein [Cyanobacteria bacterium REEB67]|nr:WG repeat-containing protein [Cyanobacteria bacterium REEB67]